MKITENVKILLLAKHFIFTIEILSYKPEYNKDTDLKSIMIYFQNVSNCY